MAEHRAGVRPGRVGDLGDGTTRGGGERGSDVDDERRLVRLPAVRDGREERGIGLDEHPVERRGRGRGADVVGVLERHDAAERERRAELQRTRAPRRGRR